MALDEFNRGLEVVDTALRESSAQKDLAGYRLVYLKDQDIGPSPVWFILTFNGKPHQKRFAIDEIEACETHVYGIAVAKIRELIDEAKG